MAVTFGLIPCANDAWCDSVIEIPYDAATLVGDLTHDEMLCQECYDHWISENWTVGEEA